MTELQGHMQEEAGGFKTDGTAKALCGEPDAYIVDVPFHLDPDEENEFWGVSCDRCTDKIERLLAAKAAEERRLDSLCLADRQALGH